MIALRTRDELLVLAYRAAGDPEVHLEALVERLATIDPADMDLPLMEFARVAREVAEASSLPTADDRLGRALIDWCRALTRTPESGRAARTVGVPPVRQPITYAWQRRADLQ